MEEKIMAHEFYDVCMDGWKIDEFFFTFPMENPLGKNYYIKEIFKG